MNALHLSVYDRLIKHLFSIKTDKLWMVRSGLDIWDSQLIKYCKWNRGYRGRAFIPKLSYCYCVLGFMGIVCHIRKECTQP